VTLEKAAVSYFVDKLAITEDGRVAVSFLVVGGSPDLFFAAVLNRWDGAGSTSDESTLSPHADLSIEKTNDLLRRISS
jgi:hypothetical protein